MPGTKRSVRARLEALTDNVGGVGCWIWKGSVGSHGYGQIYRDGAPALVHRVAHEIYIGPIPEGAHVDHTCFNRLCVNPAHLEAISQAENNRRSWRAGRVTVEKALAASVVEKRARTHCKQGHPFSGANLYVWRGRRLCRACRSAQRAR